MEKPRQHNLIDDVRRQEPNRQGQTQNPKLDILKHPKGEERLCHEKRSKGRKSVFQHEIKAATDRNRNIKSHARTKSRNH